jgi:hypothetical protein
VQRNKTESSEAGIGREVKQPFSSRQTSVESDFVRGRDDSKPDDRWKYPPRAIEEKTDGQSCNGQNG